MKGKSFEQQIEQNSPKWLTDKLSGTKTGARLIMLRHRILDFANQYATNPLGYAPSEFAQNDSIALLLRSSLIVARYLSPNDIVKMLIDHQRTAYRAGWRTNEHALAFSTKLDGLLLEALQLLDLATEEVGDLANSDAQQLQAQNEELQQQLQSAISVSRGKDVELASLKAENEALTKEVTTLRAKTDLTLVEQLKAENIELKAQIRVVHAASNAKAEESAIWRRDTISGLGSEMKGVRQTLAALQQGQLPPAHQDAQSGIDANGKKEADLKVLKAHRGKLGEKVGNHRAQAVFQIVCFFLKTKNLPTSSISDMKAYTVKLIESRTLAKTWITKLLAVENEARSTSDILTECLVDFAPKQVTPLFAQALKELVSVQQQNGEKLVKQNVGTRMGAAKYAVFMFAPETNAHSAEMYQYFSAAVAKQHISLKDIPAQAAPAAQPVDEQPSAVPGLTASTEGAVE